MKIKWGAIGRFLVKWLPGIAQAVLEAKAKKGADKPPAA